MRFRHVPARQGARWVREGLRVFLRRPIAFCVLVLIYLFVGSLVAFVVSPLASVGFMIATRRAQAGRFPLPDVFVEPLRTTAAQRWAQVKLGLAYAAVIIVVLWIAGGVGRAAFDALGDALREGNKSPQELQPLIGDAFLHLAWILGAFALASIPFWHAPALVHWGRQGAAQSLFFSTVACWRNKGAFAVYSLGWLAVLMAFSFVSAAVFALLGMPQLAVPFTMPAALMLSSAFYASLYFTFADSFELPTDPYPLETP